MTEFRRASVLVGAIETSYTRAGSGAPLVLLVPPVRDHAALAPLTRRWRVIMPESTSVLALPDIQGQGPFASWMQDFLEGLGLPSVTVVADATLSLALAEMQKARPDLIRHVQLIDGRCADWAWVAAALDAVGDD